MRTFLRTFLGILSTKAASQYSAEALYDELWVWAQAEGVAYGFEHHFVTAHAGARPSAMLASAVKSHLGIPAVADAGTQEIKVLKYLIRPDGGERLSSAAVAEIAENGK